MPSASMLLFAWLTEKGAEQRHLSATKKEGKLTTLTVKGLHIYAAKKEMQVVNIVISDSSSQESRRGPQ